MRVRNGIPLVTKMRDIWGIQRDHNFDLANFNVNLILNSYMSWISRTRKDVTIKLGNDKSYKLRKCTE